MMATIVVSGALANKVDNGGEAWIRLSWVLGLRRLGARVFFVEQIDRSKCFDEEGRPAPFETSGNRAWFDEIQRRFGLSGSAALVLGDGEAFHGLGRQELLDVAWEADLLVNISGHLRWDPFLRRVRCKVFVDEEPGFTQYWHSTGAARVAGHDHYFTLGANIGHPECRIPSAGIPWRPLSPLVVLADWPPAPTTGFDRFTTIASWRGPFGPVRFDGRTLGLKVHEFRRFVTLPQETHHCFEIALRIDPADGRDLESLRHHGWRIVDPLAVAGNPEAFRSYVRDSGGEFSVAQGVYVGTNSGWFSERTARYLASGRPALVQDTGFSRQYPVGEGLIAFRTRDEAVAGAERITRDYDTHCRRAREFAEEFFDSDRVLSGFLQAVGIAP